MSRKSIGSLHSKTQPSWHRRSICLRTVRKIRTALPTGARVGRAMEFEVSFGEGPLGIGFKAQQGAIIVERLREGGAAERQGAARKHIDRSRWPSNQRMTQPEVLDAIGHSQRPVILRFRRHGTDAFVRDDRLPHESSQRLAAAPDSKPHMQQPSSPARQTPPQPQRERQSAQELGFSFEAGSLGLALQETPDGVRVLSTLTDGPAAAQGVPIGSKLVALGETRVDGMRKDEILRLIQAAARPLQVRVAVDGALTTSSPLGSLSGRAAQEGSPTTLHASPPAQQQQQPQPQQQHFKTVVLPAPPPSVQQPLSPPPQQPQRPTSLRKSPMRAPPPPSAWADQQQQQQQQQRRCLRCNLSAGRRQGWRQLHLSLACSQPSHRRVACSALHGALSRLARLGAARRLGAHRASHRALWEGAHRRPPLPPKAVLSP